MNYISLIISVFLVFVLFNNQTVIAGNEIIDYTAKIIYEDCTGKNIDVSPLGLIYRETNVSVPVYEWPYSYDMVRRAVEIIIENEPYSLNMGGGKVKLLSCDEKELGVNLYTYFWNNERIDPFQYNLNQIIQSVDETLTEKVSQIAVQGSGNIIDASELQQTINNLNRSFQTSLESNFLNVKSEINNSKLSLIDTLNISVAFYISLTIIINIAVTIGLIFLEYKFKIIEAVSTKNKNYPPSTF